MDRTKWTDDIPVSGSSEDQKVRPRGHTDHSHQRTDRPSTDLEERQIQRERQRTDWSGQKTDLSVNHAGMDPEDRSEWAQAQAVGGPWTALLVSGLRAVGRG